MSDHDRRLVMTIPRGFACAAGAAALGLALAAWAAPALSQQGRAVQQTALPSAQPTGPIGTWIDHTGRGAVEILPCDDTTRELCGRIVWLKDPNDDKGRPLRDILNKDAGLRGKPICGLQIIGALKKQSDGSWDEGWIYDPEKGDKFDVELRMRNPEQLQVKGYLGLKFLSETYVWTRAKEPPPKCGA